MIKKMIKCLKWLLPISGVLVAILGISLFFTASENLVDLAVFIGIAIMITGITEIVSFGGKKKDERSKTMLASGIIAIMLGFSTVYGRGLEAISIVLPIFFAVWIISTSISRISNAFTQRDKGSLLWVISLSFGFLGIALGLLLLFHSQISTFVVTYSLALMFIVYGFNAVVIFVKLNGEKDANTI